LLAGCHKPSNGLSDGNNSSYISGYACQQSVTGRFDLHDSFIGFNFKERFALDDALACFFSPCEKLAGFLRHLKRGHYDADRHSFCR
jgi:hypothetical protein